MAPTRIWKTTMGILAVVCLYSALRAEPIKQLKPTGYVNDFAGVIDAESSEAIRGLCEQIDHKTKAQIAVVTIHSLDGADVESYAVDLYKAWGIGPKSDNRGVLILLAVNDHRYRTEVGYGLEPILPDGKVGGFGREVIAEDAHVELEGAPSPASHWRPGRSSPPALTIVVGLLVVVLFLAVLARL